MFSCVNFPPAARGSDFGCGKYGGKVGIAAGSELRARMLAAARLGVFTMKLGLKIKNGLKWIHVPPFGVSGGGST